MPSDDAAYEARYQWTPAISRAIAIDVAFVLIAVLIPMPMVIRVAGVAVFGYFGVLSIAAVLSRKIAFRAGQHGITLGGSAFRYRATTRFFPWADISKIIIWKRQVPVSLWRWMIFSYSIRYIGLQRNADAPPVSRDGRGRLDGPAYKAPVSGIAAGAARNVTAWILNAGKLALAIAAYAPDVPVEYEKIVTPISWQQRA